MLYRAHWKGGLVILAVSVPTLLFSGIAFLIGLKSDLLGALIFLGAICVTLLFMRQGLRILSRRYEVNPFGLTVREGTGLGTGRGFRWAEVESWLVWPSESIAAEDSIRVLYPDSGLPRPRSDYRGVAFRIDGRTPHFLIDEWEVSVPSFPQFLEDVRRYAADKEVATAGTLSPRMSASEAIQIATTSIKSSSP